MTSLPRDTGWFKSTRSGAANESCVEVRITQTAIGVRDSKNPAGPFFLVGNPAWARFLGDAKCDECLIQCAHCTE